MLKLSKALFCDKNLKQKEVNSTSFQGFAFCKNSSFTKSYKKIAFKCSA